MLKGRKGSLCHQCHLSFLSKLLSRQKQVSFTIWINHLSELIIRKRKKIREKPWITVRNREWRILMDVSLHCDSERTTDNAQRYLTLFRWKFSFFSNFIETLCCSFFIFSYFCRKERGMKEKVIFLLLIIMILTSCAGNRKYDD